MSRVKNDTQADKHWRGWDQGYDTASPLHLRSLTDQWLGLTPPRWHHPPAEPLSCSTALRRDCIVCMCGQEMECNINTTWQSIPCHTDCNTKQAAFPPEHPTIVDHGCWPCDLMLKDGGGPRRVCVSQKSIKGGDLFTSWLWHLKGAHCERGIVSENTKDQLAALLGARARTRTHTSTSHI